MTAPAPSVTSLEILPVFGQSENRSTLSPLAAVLDAASTGQVYFTAGMATTTGAAVGPDGAGLAEIDRQHPASGIPGAGGLGRVSPAFTLQHARAARWRDAGDTARGVVIADHGFSGRTIGEWRQDHASPLGRNQLYWMRETARLAQVSGIALACPYACLFQGTSAKDQPGPAYRAEFEAAHADMQAQAVALFGAGPRLVVVVNGADVNSAGDLYAVPGAQYRLALDHQGIIATWQRIYPIHDRNVHLADRIQVLVGETCEWAIAETEAGRDWNITYAVARSGATVTVSFALRPGETLMQRDALYDGFGGAATCPHHGFEAEGGIVSAVPDLAGNTVTITLASASAGWLRFAHQVQDCSALTDAQGRTMSAHRSTLFGSHSRPSRFLPDETLWRPLPGFRGSFSGDVFVPDAGG